MIFGYFWFRLYQRTTNPRADYQGIVYSTIGFGALLYGFSEAGNKGWGSNRNDVHNWCDIHSHSSFVN